MNPSDFGVTPLAAIASSYAAANAALVFLRE
jgi:hypothetical protein